MALVDIDADRLLPTEKAYSIVRVTVDRPPSDPDCAVKLTEVDSLESESGPGYPGVIWVAYDRDGNGQIL